MQILTSGLSHQDILEVLIRCAVLLFGARALGELFSRAGQPGVIGELLAGILLGPSLLGNMFPAYGSLIVPGDAVDLHLLEFLQLLGALFLLLLTGLEIDFPLIRSNLKTAVSVAAGGLLLPFAGGYLIAFAAPRSLLLPDVDKHVFALFVATAMAISAIPVIAKVLMDLQLTRRSIAQVIIAAAMIDDAIGWTLLSIVGTLVVGGTLGGISIGMSLLKVVLFFVAGIFVSRKIMSVLLDLVQSRGHGGEGALALIVCGTFAWAAAAQAIHIEAIFGAFIFGASLSLCANIDHPTIHTLELLGLKIFGPLFFAIAGLKVDLTLLANPEVAAYAALFLGLAIVTKIGGAFAGARLLAKADTWSALFYGSGLTARGSMGVIIATVGLSHGILTLEMFTVLILMAIGTSLASPPLLRWCVSRIPIAEEERLRLEQEQLNKGDPFAQMRKVLVPVRFQPEAAAMSELKRLLIDRLRSRHQFSLTLVTVVEDGGQNEGKTFLEALAARIDVAGVNLKVLVGEAPADMILEEARKGYDLLILGASRSTARAPNVLFTPFTDYLMRLAPCPILLLKEPLDAGTGLSLERVLVPTNGSLASRRACQLACSLLNREDETLIVLSVVESSPAEWMSKRHTGYAEENVEELSQLAAAYGVASQKEVRLSPEPERVVLETCEELGIHAILLGTSVRAGSDRLFLGPRVERILRDSPVPIVIVNS